MAIPLSREAVVDAALRVTEARGIDGLTMRSVGSELGVSAMALYNHVANKEELVDLVAFAVVSRWEPLALGPDGWRASLRRHLVSQWREQARYPGLSGVLVEKSLTGAMPQSLPKAINFFEEAGFDEGEAHLAWAFARTYVSGRLNVEAHLRGVTATDRREADFHSEDYVQYGIDAVIAGIEALRPHHSASASGSMKRRAASS